MDPQILIIAGGIAVAIFSVVVYAFLAILFPEWVGITGKVAKRAEESHAEGSEAKKYNNFTDEL